jgi:NadR type nicotinamide-nucleotide adenylyltransferase
VSAADPVLTLVVTGSESTGKTTLARLLAARHETSCSPEFAREYLERKRALLTAADVAPIAEGQREGEDAASRRARLLVVKDTDLISTVLYARHYYGSCPEWIEVEARARRGHLYLLCHPDVPWSADGLQRDRPHRRQEMHALFVATLAEFEAPVAQVTGSWAEREALAREAASRLLAQGR